MNASVIKIFFPYVLVIISLENLRFSEVIVFVGIGFSLFTYLCVKNGDFRTKNFLLLVISSILIIISLYNHEKKFQFIVDREITITGKIIGKKFSSMDNNLKIFEIKILNTNDVLKMLRGKELLCTFYELDKIINREEILNFNGILTQNNKNNLIIKNCKLRSRLNNNKKFINTNFIKLYFQNAFKSISLNQDVNAFLNAIILGNKNLMSIEEKDIYRYSGTMHLFAVSGIHVGFIYLILNLIFTIIFKNRFLCQAIITVFLATYLDIVNYPPSAQRAFTMILFWQITKLLNKKNNLVSSLLWSALITIIFDPEQLFSVGYQLSYSVVFAIIIILSSLNYKIKNKFGNFFLSSLKTSYAAFCGSMLLIYDYFEIIVPGSILINMLVVPICFVFIIILFIIIILLPVFDFNFYSETIYFLKYLIDYIIKFFTCENYTYFIFDKKNDVNNFLHLVYPFTFFLYRKLFYNSFLSFISLLFIPFFIFLFFI